MDPFNRYRHVTPFSFTPRDPCGVEIADADPVIGLVVVRLIGAVLVVVVEAGRGSGRSIPASQGFLGVVVLQFFLNRRDIDAR